MGTGGLRQEASCSETRWSLCQCMGARESVIVKDGETEPPTVIFFAEDVTGNSPPIWRNLEEVSTSSALVSSLDGSGETTKEEDVERDVRLGPKATNEWRDKAARIEELRGQVEISPKHPLAVASRIKTNVRKIQKEVQRRIEASAHELDRGIYIDRVYDLYCPASKATRVMKMTDEVIFTRSPYPSGSGYLLKKKSSGESSGDEVSSDACSLDLETSWSFASGGSSHSGEPSRDCSKASLASGDDPELFRTWATRNNRNKKHTASNMELVTQWGVVVGKLLRSKVLDFGEVMNSAIGRNRMQCNAKASTVLTSLRQRAEEVCEQARAMAARVAKEKVDRFDSEWKSEGTLVDLFSTEYLDTLILLANGTRKLLSSQPMLAEASAPARVFGDIHGQFRDVLLLFHAFGAPKKNSPTYVFNGDFVDRGVHQLEVLGVLFAMKLAYPQKVWLVRGNHEDRSMNVNYGLQAECQDRLGKQFGDKIFETVQKTFEQLPIALVIDERVLVVHGGIGRGKWNLSDCKAVRRPLSAEELAKPENEWIYDILWSDPIEDCEGGVFGVHQSPRGKLASQFAWDVTKTFCARNGLSLIIRSHQSKVGSLGFEVMHEHLLMRVFSARDYEGHGNDGAVLTISRKDEDSRMLTVRPQVLRSTTKLREEDASQRELFEAEKARKRRHSVRSGGSRDRERSPSKESGASLRSMNSRESNGSSSSRRKVRAGLAAVQAAVNKSQILSSESTQVSDTSGPADKAFRTDQVPRVEMPSAAVLEDVKRKRSKLSRSASAASKGSAADR